jgi:hypothetical protein
VLANQRLRAAGPPGANYRGWLTGLMCRGAYRDRLQLRADHELNGAYAIHKGFTYAVKSATIETVLEARSFFK